MQSKSCLILFFLIFCSGSSLFAQLSIKAFEINGSIAFPKDFEVQRFFPVDDIASVSSLGTFNFEGNIRALVRTKYAKLSPVFGLGYGALSLQISSFASNDYVNADSPFGSIGESQMISKSTYFKSTIGIEYKFNNKGRRTFFIRPLLDVVWMQPKSYVITGKGPINYEELIAGNPDALVTIFEADIESNPKKNIFALPSLELGIRRRLNSTIVFQLAISGSYSPYKVINNAPFRLIGTNEIREGTLSQQFIKKGLNIGFLFNK